MEVQGTEIKGCMNYKIPRLEAFLRQILDLSENKLGGGYACTLDTPSSADPGLSLFCFIISVLDIFSAVMVVYRSEI